MKECPKCGYVCQPGDDDCVPSSECPKCRIIYARYEAYLSRKQAEQEAERAIKEQTKAQLPAEESRRNSKPVSPLNILFDSMFLKYICFEDLRQSEILSRFLSRLKNSLLIQWVIKQKDCISSLLFTLWILGCGYWLYQLVTIRPGPQDQMILMINTGGLERRDALTFLFFGGIACFFFIILALYLIKLVYNMTWEGVQRRFPKEWHSFINSVILIILLYSSFPVIKRVKIVGMSAYYQIVELVQVSKGHNLIINTDSHSLKRLEME